MPIRKPTDERKAQIVAEALHIADAVGPDRLTTQAVAAAVGLTQPAIFRHFPTKQSLWQAVAETITARLGAAWSDVLAETSDPQARIERLVLVQLRQIEAMPAIPSILFSRELQVENDELRQSVFGLMTRLVALLSDEMARGQGAGVFRPDMVPRDAAYLLVSLVQGLAIRWTLGRRAFPLEAEGRRLLAAQLVLFARPTDKESTS